MSSRKRYWSMNVVLILSLILGFGFDVVGFTALAKFIIWFYFLASVLLASMPDHKIKPVEGKPPVPRSFDYALDWVITCILAFCGHWGYAGMYLFHVLVVQSKVKYTQE